MSAGFMRRGSSAVRLLPLFSRNKSTV